MSHSPSVLPALDALGRLQPVGASHDDVRRYSRARRNVLPRGGPRHRRHGCLGARGGAPQRTPPSTSCCGARASGRTPSSRRRPPTARRARDRAFRISERTLARIQPDATAPALLSLVRLPTVGAASRCCAATPGSCSWPTASSTPATSAPWSAPPTPARPTRSCSRARRHGSPTRRRSRRAGARCSRRPCSTYPSIAEARHDLAAAGFATYVADPAGATPYRSAGLGSGRTAVVVGSEGDGVSDEWRPRAAARGDPDARPRRLAERGGVGGRAAVRGPRRPRPARPADDLSATEP